METYARITGRSRDGVYRATARDGRVLVLAGSQDREDLRIGHRVLCEGIWVTERSLIASEYRVANVTRGRQPVGK